ncbi:phosphoglycerate mutase-like protein [Polychaeton citri CBS 116435]|uniref:Phosphoglycerate mutase-like protein n=1 Tax=Polychaeton citri CBS 116435 TaxID=1314669 RepID=A0A9P4UR23_9PEZI|nr:phosphoglycerate mutase-like protein [Polychaeton citri CBS 116435]
MLALCFALVSTLVLSPSSVLAQSSGRRYTVWSSVIFSRTGERTPRMLGNISPQLTSLGAQQQYDTGAFFRNRYIQSQDANSSSGAYDDLDKAPLQNLNQWSSNPVDVWVGAMDDQYSSASAQAFLQGLYPPVQLNLTGNPDNNTRATSFAQDGEFIEAPLRGYQYSQISTYGPQDPMSIYIGGFQACPAWSTNAVSYTGTPEYATLEDQSRDLYNSVGAPYLIDVLPSSLWNYFYAWDIYDYLNYLSSHDASANAVLASNDNIDQLRYFADEMNWARLGNLSAINDLNNVEMPAAITSGSVSTIAGNMLAYRMLDQLRQFVSSGGESLKLSLMFGDFEPLTSLFAVLETDHFNSDFRGMADFASTAVFELFTHEDPDNPRTTLPSEDDLWVNFFFRNGTEGEYIAYPILGNGPDSYQLQWSQFENEMWSVALGEVADWCNICASPTLFCSPWTGSVASGEEPNTQSSSSSSNRHHGGLSPAVSGVIGAIIALVLAGMLFGLAMLVGGVRLHRNRRNRPSSSSASDDLASGGFKGSQKLRSDPDLTISKSGPGAHVEPVDGPMSPITGAHERTGSWEGDQSHHRPSFDTDDQYDQRAVNPFEDPVKPDERV